MAAGAALVPLIGCGSDGSGGPCDEIPDETEGPYPGDGTNGPNVLTESGIVRSDIRSSFGALSGTAAGVPLTLELMLVDAGDATCAALSGLAVYAWHCTKDGGYSLYSSGVTDQNFLRGVQESDADGVVRFTTIFPGCYDGRWPHVHFEVFAGLSAATSGDAALKTSQLAFPEDACSDAYAASGYESSVSNLSRVSLDSDGIFRDGYDNQLATVTGDASSGFVASLVVSVDP